MLDFVCVCGKDFDDEVRSQELEEDGSVFVGQSGHGSHRKCRQPIQSPVTIIDTQNPIQKQVEKTQTVLRRLGSTKQWNRRLKTLKILINIMKNIEKIYSFNQGILRF